MSDLTRPMDGARTPGSAQRASIAQRRSTRRRAALLAAIALQAWSIVELGSLLLRHTTGPEVYGVLVAALAVGAGAATLVLLAPARRRAVALIGALALWTVVGLGGLAGVAAHAIGTTPEHGPVDPRPRPLLAPLAFTGMGVAGVLTVILGYRAGIGQPRPSGKE